MVTMMNPTSYFPQTFEAFSGETVKIGLLVSKNSIWDLLKATSAGLSLRCWSRLMRLPRALMTLTP